MNFLVRISCGRSRQENPLFGADVHDFRHGRPWPEGLSKNFVQKKFALIFWPQHKTVSTDSWGPPTSATNESGRERDFLTIQQGFFAIDFMWGTLEYRGVNIPKRLSGPLNRDRRYYLSDTPV